MRKRLQKSLTGDSVTAIFFERPPKNRHMRHYPFQAAEPARRDGETLCHVDES